MEGGGTGPGPLRGLWRGVVAVVFLLAFLGAYVSAPDVWLGGAHSGLQLRPEPVVLPSALAFGLPGVVGASFGLLLHNLLFRAVPGGISLAFSLVQTALVGAGGVAALYVRRRAPLPVRNLAATWTLSLFLVVPLGVFAAWEEGTTAVLEGQHIFREVLLPINLLGFALLEAWDLRGTRNGWGRRVLRHLSAPGIRLLPIFALVTVGLVAFPSGAVARCFGEPPSAAEEPSWSTGLRVESLHGLWNLAYPGVDARATDRFDPDFDVTVSLFESGINPEDTIALFLYFFYPDNPNSSTGVENPGATATLTQSIIPPGETMIWPLRVAYFFPVETVLTLFWTPEAVNQSGFVMHLVTPSGERVAMADASTYSFQATPGFFDFTIQASGGSLDPLEGLLLLIIIVAAYVLAVVGFLWFRYVRRRRGPLAGGGGRA